jgi:hypothetical protein
MVRSIISSFVVTGIVLFAAADVEAGKPRRHGSICDEAGLIGSAYGACNAYCEALDCDSPEPGGSERACEQALNRFMKLTGELPPCEPVCPCSAAWRDEGFIDHDSVLFAECFGEKGEGFLFADLWVVDELKGSVAAVTFAFSDDPDGGMNSVACSAVLDPEDPENQVSGDFSMTSSFSPEPVQFNAQKNRIFRACEAEFQQLIERLGVECFQVH